MQRATVETIFRHAQQYPLIFDIETVPRRREQIEKYFSFKKAHPGEFDPASVRYGNTKAEDKRAAKLEQAEQSHAQKVRDWERERDEARDEWLAAAALKAEFSECCLIGLGTIDSRGQLLANVLLGGIWEAVALQTFWRLFKSAPLKVGFYSNSFDLPYLVRRSFILGVKHEYRLERGRWAPETCVDLASVWQAGNTRDSIKLSTLADVLGVEGKHADVEATDLPELMETNVELAVDYCLQDIVCTHAVARAMGVV